jgi:hypothetical protein
MSNVRNAGVAGGALLLVLWGGIGFFFGNGKGKGKGKNQPTKARVDDRTTTRTPPPTRVEARTRPAPAPTATKKETYRYILRMKYIHPVLPDGTRSEKTITLDELVALGQQAMKDKKEIQLKVSGDARAIWLNKLKQTLKKKNVSYSISDDF